MRPPVWNPPIELSAKEQKVVSRIRKAKLFIFLRQERYQLFDEQFQKELATLFKNSSMGKCPVSPAQLALATILQAYTGVSDEEVIEALEMDRRWQLVLDCLDCEQAPFGKGTLVRFRAALIAKEGDRRLVERTVEIAKKKGGFSSGSLRAALDSSPLWGAARVEDTYNLLGHALRKALGVIARQQQRDLADVATEAGAEIIAGSSLKAALDLDWDNPVAKVHSRCTSSVKGRSVSIHPDESLLQELRQRQHSQLGRAQLRERVAVEHSLAHIGQWQGDRARYLGIRKNLFDLRRLAVVHNLHVIARMSQPQVEQAA